MPSGSLGDAGLGNFELGGIEGDTPRTMFGQVLIIIGRIRSMITVNTKG